MNMTTTKTFSEMLHGDIRRLKLQETGQKHKGKTVLVLDAEPYIRLITSDLPMMSALTVGMGYGKGMQAKRKMLAEQNVVAEINQRHPALAAEHRVGGQKAERSIALEMKRLRDWKKMHWAYYYGRGDQFDEQSVMRLT